MAKRTSSETQKLRRHFSAGGTVYREEEGRAEWLIINPRGTKRWQLPKGTIDQGEKSAETAIREVFEETGIKAEIISKIESVRYFFFQDGEKIFKTVNFFLMKGKGEPNIAKEWSHEIGEVIWIETTEALKKLTFKGEKKILEKAASLI